MIRVRIRVTCQLGSKINQVLKSSGRPAFQVLCKWAHTLFCIMSNECECVYNACSLLVWGTPPLALNHGGSGTDTVSGFVRLAVHTASQSDSSFGKRHEKITSIVWSDQSDSRFTAGSL